MSKNINSSAALFICLAFIAVGQVFGEEADITLCAAHEDVYFSCPLSGAKIVSVCASGNDKPDAGYAQYRYGSQGNIEMVYPQEKVPPKGRLFVVDASEGDVSKAIIKFRKDDCVYVVAQAFVSYLTVLKSNKVILRASCEEGGNAFVSRIARQGIESAPKSDEDFL